MKEAKRSEVERFLRSEGYEVASESGGHQKWSRPGARSIPLPRHSRISPGVLRSIEKIVGHVPESWK
ncbi:type II toxin-antitoxin system HicA family toxin [Agrococcus sp. Ld7]|uniref:type II toxin-antitoxin system HicA family toxin n=1 Tax=Agrococcus sp. Ld7 TaxID=649148 RepID=UPI00386AA24E